PVRCDRTRERQDILRIQPVIRGRCRCEPLPALFNHLTRITLQERPRIKLVDSTADMLQAPRKRLPSPIVALCPPPIPLSPNPPLKPIHSSILPSNDCVFWRAARPLFFSALSVASVRSALILRFVLSIGLGRPRQAPVARMYR